MLQVSPSEIESVILKLPGVADVGVVGVPHEVDFHHTTALVVKKPNSEIKEKDIVNYVEGDGGTLFQNITNGK